MADFATGDPYMAFGIRAGLLPADITKAQQKNPIPAFATCLRQCVLGVQFGMGFETLAFRIGKSTITARQLIQAHEDRYPKFWRMADSAVACAMQGQPISTVFGWHVRASSEQWKWRSLLNFPMQANGAEMMRLACCMAVEAGIEVCAPVHDAFLICAPLDQIDARVAEMKFIMEEASRIVLDGFTIKADCPEFDGNGKLLEFPQIVRYPNRYMIKRGAKMWKTVMEILERFKEEDRGRGGVMEEFSAESLKLKPEHLKNLRPVEKPIVRKRQKREFIQITREQSKRLDKAKPRRRDRLPTSDVPQLEVPRADHLSGQRRPL